MKFGVRPQPVKASLPPLNSNEYACAKQGLWDFRNWVQSIKLNLSYNGAKLIAGSRWRKVFKCSHGFYCECYFDYYPPKGGMCVLDHVKVK